jgi:hypothetical protein
MTDIDHIQGKKPNDDKMRSKIFRNICTYRKVFRFDKLFISQRMIHTLNIKINTTNVFENDVKMKWIIIYVMNLFQIGPPENSVLSFKLSAEI